MASSDNNNNNNTSRIAEAVKTVVGAGKAVAKGVAGDVAGATKEAIKIAPQLIKIALILLLIISIITASFLSTPAMIWNGISKKYSEWSLSKAVDSIDEAFNKSAANVCDGAINNLNCFIPDFESLRNQFYADGQDGISVMMLENGDSFYIAIDETGNDVLINYYSAENNDYTEFRYLNGNNFYNDPVNINYSEIINAYIYSKSKENDKTEYEFIYDNNNNITGVTESDSSSSVWNIEDIDDSSYVWGLTDVAGLYKKLTESEISNNIFKIEYLLGPDAVKYEQLDSESALTDANNESLASDKGYNHYYQISIDVSTYSSETKTATNSNFTYSTLTQKMFNLTDEEMSYVAEKSAISNGIIEAAMKSADESTEIPSDFSEYFIFSPAKKIFDNLLNGKSVLQQLTEDGLIMDNLTETTCRTLIAGKALSAHKSKLAVTYNNWLGISSDDTFTKYFGESVKNAQVGDSGLFTTYIFYTALANSTLSLRDSLFETSDDSIIYKSEDYAQYLTNNGRYYKGNNVDLSSDTKIQQGDLIFFGVDSYSSGNFDSNGNIIIAPSEPKRTDNVQVGIVTSVSGNKISVVIYNWLENRSYDTTAETISQIFNWGIDSLIGENSYTTSLITIDLSNDNDAYKEYISGYAKPDYNAFVTEYNELYAQQIEDLTNSSSVINSNTGSGTLGYPTDYRKISAGYPNYSNGSYHGGVDWPCPTGSNVYAAESGTVITAQKLSYSYGYYIVIDHGNGMTTLYAHNSQLLVTVGTKVARGQLIAKSGSTGNSTGPHCHFEVKINNKRVNPLAYLAE